MLGWPQAGCFHPSSLPRALVDAAPLLTYSLPRETFPCQPRAVREQGDPVSGCTEQRQSSLFAHLVHASSRGVEGQCPLCTPGCDPLGPAWLLPAG